MGEGGSGREKVGGWWGGRWEGGRVRGGSWKGEVGNRRIAVDRWKSNRQIDVDRIDSVMAC